MHDHAEWDYIMPVGPQSPAMKEPMLLKLHLHGEQIELVGIEMGYLHKGIEKLLEGKNPDNAMYLATRICGICSFSHENAYLRTAENILGAELPERVKYIRTIMFELERMTSHILWAGYMMHEIGYDSLFHFFWREREKLLDAFEKSTGNRVHHNLGKIGSLRNDLDESQLNYILEQVEDVAKNIKNYSKEIQTNHIVRARLQNVGTISKEDAEKYCLVGPIARASGLKCDIRKTDPYNAYSDFKFHEILAHDGDALARTLLRIREVQESAKIIKQAIEKMPKQKIPPFKFTAMPDKDGFGRVEAPRGELFYYLDFKNNLVNRAKIRTPTFAYIKILEKILTGTKIGDAPVIIASLDPCFSCLERVLIAKDGVNETINEKQFRERFTCTK